MPWADLTVRLEMEWRKLDGSTLLGLLDPFPHTKEEFAETTSKRESTTSGRIDTAAREFASNKSWPKLSNDEIYFLEQRLYYAWLLANVFAATGTRPQKTGVPTDELAENEQAALEWLLIDCWPALGCSMWLDTQVERYAVLAAASQCVQQ